MTNKQLQELLQKYPDNMSVKIITNQNSQKVHPFDNENIIETSTTAYIDDEAPEEEWDTEDGKIMLGDGVRYLLINPIIL